LVIGYADPDSVITRIIVSKPQNDGMAAHRTPFLREKIPNPTIGVCIRRLLEKGQLVLWFIISAFVGVFGVKT
jgi:hypothetical protein